MKARPGLEMTGGVLLWREMLRTSLWPLPVAMLLLAIVLFVGARWLDRLGPDASWLRAWHLHSGSGDDARNLLSTLVAAIITMSSVVFSITIVALSLAANQFGSRLVRTYIGDVRTKFALGTFMMTIVYCLLALRSVAGDMQPQDVPHLTVSLGLGLGIACVLALLLFIHVVARSMVADEVISRVARELEDNIESLPLLDSRPDRPHAAEPGPAGRRHILASRAEGYVQTVDYEAMARVAARHDVLVRLSFRAGDFMCKEGWLGEVDGQQAPAPALTEGIQQAVVIGPIRTPTQDIQFSMRHLVDIALRALSPGINDPNTALVVIDRMRGALSRLMARALPEGIYCDEAGRARVLARSNSYGDLLDAALHQIRQAAAPHPAVVTGLLVAFGRIGEHVRLAEQRDALIRHAQLTAAGGLREAGEPADRREIEEVLAATLWKLDQVDFVEGTALPAIPVTSPTPGALQPSP